MPRDAQATRRRILDAAYLQFRRKGYARVNMDEIAAAAKITKRTLYHHFTSKDELLAAVFDMQHELALSSFDSFGTRAAENAGHLVDIMFNALLEWSAKPRWAGSGYTRVAMELADLPGHPARVIARRHKAILEQHLADMLAKAGIADADARAREIWMLCEGAMVLILIHGDRGYVTAAAEAARRLLETQPASGKRKRTACCVQVTRRNGQGDIHEPN
ncbi:MAG: TetR/AcrR family transcriptional regulator [Pseudorhodoplanes sp.]|nr:hypothetical protein [Pseudorhodoplanes sp.]MCL4710588.1 TetR/AcrR family transcriptional regulator [Pseudorhodoplanes sp.]GIK79274.1 MAG: TetR family transcriptional regulator [Alphaproteobacteria bacterium]